MSKQPEYLGDSVYVTFDGFMFCLTTNNGMGATNTIYLELPVLDALNRYAEKVLCKEPETEET